MQRDSATNPQDSAKIVKIIPSFKKIWLGMIDSESREALLLGSFSPKEI
jgi:hypothetical protein